MDITAYTPKMEPVKAPASRQEALDALESGVIAAIVVRDWGMGGSSLIVTRDGSRLYDPAA